MTDFKKNKNLYKKLSAKIAKAMFEYIHGTQTGDYTNFINKLSKVDNGFKNLIQAYNATVSSEERANRILKDSLKQASKNSKNIADSELTLARDVGRLRSEHIDDSHKIKALEARLGIHSVNSGQPNDKSDDSSLLDAAKVVEDLRQQGLTSDDEQPKSAEPDVRTATKPADPRRKHRAQEALKAKYDEQAVQLRKLKRAHDKELAQKEQGKPSFDNGSNADTDADVDDDTSANDSADTDSQDSSESDTPKSSVASNSVSSEPFGSDSNSDSNSDSDDGSDADSNEQASSSSDSSKSSESQSDQDSLPDISIQGDGSNGPEPSSESKADGSSSESNDPQKNASEVDKLTSTDSTLFDKYNASFKKGSDESRGSDESDSDDSDDE